MRIAHLGVVIDSSGARKGAEESKAALVDVGATAERAAKARVAATDAVTGAAARNTTAQRLNNADISASVKRYDDMIAAMKRQTAAATGVTQANRQVTDSTRAMGLAHAEAIRMNDALGKSGGVTNSMLNRLRPGFSSLATQVLGTNSAVGALGGTIGQFSIGAGPTIAILAGIAAVSAAYTRLTAHTRAQAEEQKKATKAALDFAKGQREGVGQGVDAQIGALQKLIAQQKLFGEVARGGKVSASQIAEVGLIASLNITLTDPAERTRLIKENEEALVAAKDRLRKLFLQANRDAESDRNAALASLAAANEATVDEQKETVDRLRALRQLLAQNTAFAASSAENASATRGDRVRLIAEIKVLGDAYDGLAKSAEKRATAEKKAADEVIDFAKRYEASLASVRKGIQEYDDAEEKKRKTLKDANETIALSIEARQLDIETMREQVAVANDISGAFSSLAVAREQEKAVAAARAKLPDGEALSSATTDKIREQVKEYYRLKAVLDALNELKGKSPFAIPERDTKAWADSLQLVAREAGAIAGIFGGIGTAITKAVQLASQFVASMGAAQKAAKAAEAAKGTAGAGAANSAAQGASLAAGVNFATLAVTGIKYWHDSVRATSAAAEQAAIALRELGNSAKKAATSYVLQATGTQLDQQLAQLKAAFQSVITDLLAAGAPRTAALGQRTAKSTVPTAAEVDAAIAAYDRLVAAAKRAAAFQAKQADEELAVRLATAQGRTAEAEAIRQQIRFEKELEEARLAGASAALLAQIALVQAAEAAFAARQKARTANEFGAGLTAREQSRAGNNRGAFVTRQGIDSSRELNAAADMVAAGTITAEMFERLKVVIGEEMVDALKAFDAAVAAALQAQQEDLAIRTLLATGNEAGAAALRREIANRKELEGVTDVALIAHIKYVQGLEAIAIVQAPRPRKRNGSRT